MYHCISLNIFLETVLEYIIFMLLFYKEEVPSNQKHIFAEMYILFEGTVVMLFVIWMNNLVFMFIRETHLTIFLI